MKVVSVLLYCFLVLGCRDIKKEETGTPPLKASNPAPRPLFHRGMVIQNMEAYPDFLLDSLQEGFDSVQIRVWTISGLYSRTNLYVIKKNGTGWTGRHIRLEIEEKYSNGDSSSAYMNGPLPFIIQEAKRFVPQEGWRQFILKVKPETLRALPNMVDLKNPPAGYTDGTLYYLEYATKGYYHRSEYYDAHRYIEYYPETRYVSHLVDLLREATSSY